jgi:hypothetical protein
MDSRNYDIYVREVHSGSKLFSKELKTVTY